MFPYIKVKTKASSLPPTTSMEFHLEAEYTQSAAVPDDALEYKMPVGKHKGKALGDIASTWHGRRYLDFMQTKGLYPETLRCIQSALQATPEVEMTLSEAGDVIVRFGQYRDTTLREICGKKGGLGYLKWVNGWDKCPDEVREATNVIIGEWNAQKQA